MGDDPYVYLATVDPFHGNLVTVYTRPPGDALTDHPSGSARCSTPSDCSTPRRRAPATTSWLATSTATATTSSSSPSRVRSPHQGVYYYKAIDVEGGIFERWRVPPRRRPGSPSATSPGTDAWDFATTGYFTPGYFLCDNAQVNVFLNRFGNAVSQ